jgi:hypothetical protein
MDENAEHPVDLTPLADVVPPSTVSRAVRRYGRRVAVIVAALCLVLAVAEASFQWFVIRPVRDTPARILAKGHAYFGGVQNVGGYQVLVLEAADLRPAFGVHLVVIDPPGTPAKAQVFVMPESDVKPDTKIYADAPSIGSGSGSGWTEYWFRVLPGHRRVVRFSLYYARSQSPFAPTQKIGDFSVKRLPGVY